MVLINTDYLLLLQNICKKEILSLKDADKEQSKSINTLSGLNRGKIPAEEPTPKSKPTPKSRPEPMVFDVKLRKRFMNKIENNENNIHNEIFREYFGCQNQ